MAVAVALVGTALSFMGQQQQAAAAEKAERSREQQMNLDVQRKKREALRQAAMARQTALANATNQGAASGSGLQGGYGQIGGQNERNLKGLNQDKEIGGQIFAANRDYAAGGALAGFGQALVGGSQAVGRIGSVA